LTTKSDFEVHRRRVQPAANPQSRSMDRAGFDGDRPITIRGKLAKLPAALAPLVARPQWCVWKWTKNENGAWQKPPFIAVAPDRHASSTNPATWCDYPTALATVQAKNADGLTYILTPDDPFGAADVDHCRDLATGAIADWAQQWLDQAAATYVEVTPSGTDVRIWGTITTESALHTNGLLDGGGRLELFRRTSKPLTVTGKQLGKGGSFGDIDALLERAAAWAKQHKASSIKAATSSPLGVPESSLSQLSIDAIEEIVREGAPPGGNRSDLFHAIVGHYWACGWSREQIAEHLEQYPGGISDRYQAEGRLGTEIDRSLEKWEARQQQFKIGDWSSGVIDVSELDEEPTPPLQLPQMYCHGDPDPRPLTSWLVKRLLASVSYGILSGQWGTGKTFLVFELSACLMTGQPFIGHIIKQQCGVLYVAAEGVNEIRRRLDAVIQHKCGGMQRAPFRWYEAAPTLLGPDAVEKLTAMAKQADASLQREFGFPLGLIVVDTIAAAAGYAQQGAENDSAVGVHIMRVLQQVATACSCVVLGVDHFGKKSIPDWRSARIVVVCKGRNIRSRCGKSTLGLMKIMKRSPRWWSIGNSNRVQPSPHPRPIRGSKTGKPTRARPCCCSSA
jgi:hypothetical protein